MSRPDTREDAPARYAAPLLCFLCRTFPEWRNEGACIRCIDELGLELLPGNRVEYRARRTARRS